MMVRQLIEALLRYDMEAIVSIGTTENNPLVHVIGAEISRDWSHKNGDHVALKISHPVSTTIPQAAETP